jgi:hypothetical protein
VSDRTCSIDGCERNILARKLCNLHYNRLNKYGTTDVRPRIPFEQRFWAKVNKTESCWDWTGYVDPQLGYGHTWYDGRQQRVHRVSYQLEVGEIPEGMMIDHRCHNRKCVNPDHLRLATMKQNQENRAGAIKPSQSGVRGVSWSKGNKRWLVTIGHNGRTVYGGQFKELADAESAAIALRNKLFTHNDLDRQLA